MTENITRREWEALSAYLDGELLPREQVRLEKILQERQNLRAALIELRRTRGLLRNQPAIRSPRNFTLTPGMAGVHPVKRTVTWTFNSMRLASVLASALFVLVILTDVFIGSRASKGLPMTADTQGLQEFSQPVEEAAVEEAPATTQENLEPPMAMQVETESEIVIYGTGTPEAGMTMAMPPSMDLAAKSAYPSAEEPPAAYPAVAEPRAAAPLEAYPGSGTTAQVEEAPMAESVMAIEAGEAETVEGSEASPGFWTIWRIFEIGLVVIGIITGVFAFYLRRTGRV